MAENFDLIFGQSASQQYAWSDSDYQNGWGTVGSTPPTAEQFDALQNRSDKKSQELNNRLTPLESNAEASFRQPLTTYNEGDMRYCDGLPPLWFLYCSVGGTTSSGAITLPDPLNENAVITDGTVTWKIRKISSADGVPIGAIIQCSSNGNLPSGYLLCDGAAYSRTMFPDLFAAIGTTYGAGDGSTTFNVPDYNTAQRFAQGGTVAGTVKEAGLPNITGQAHVGVPSNNGGMNPTGVRTDNPNGSLYGSGVLTSAQGYWNVSGTVVSSENRNISLDASKSSSIYGNSDTVQPNALTTRYIIKAFDGQTADSALIDITQYAQELAGKANITGSNLVHHRDVITTSGTYTAPVTGLYKITVKGGGGGGQGGGYQSTNYYAGSGGSEGGTTIAFEKMTAGDTATVVIGAGGAGGAKSTSNAGSVGGDGGDSSVTVNLTTYTGGGGKGGTSASSVGGTGTIPGAPGGAGGRAQTLNQLGASGGGQGGGNNSVGIAGGGGSGGGTASGPIASDGFAGGDGFVWIEYYTPGA